MSKIAEGYKKIGQGFVDGFEKVSDKFVEKLFAKEGECMEEAKARLSGSQEEK